MKCEIAYKKKKEKEKKEKKRKKKGLQEQDTGFTGGRKWKAMTRKWADDP